MALCCMERLAGNIVKNSFLSEFTVIVAQDPGIVIILVV